MKNQLVFILLLAGFNICLGQEQKYSEYSYTEFFEMIALETDTVFKLNDALIKYNDSTDHRFKDAFTGKGEKLYHPEKKIIVDKRIELNNVQFLARIYNENNEGYYDGVVKDIHFKKDVILSEVSSLSIGSCIFDGAFEWETLMCAPKGVDILLSSGVAIRNSRFNDRFYLNRNCIDNTSKRGFVIILNNEFKNNENGSYTFFGVRNSSTLTLEDNVFKVNGLVEVYSLSLNSCDLVSNSFESKMARLSISQLDSRATITGNQFSSSVIFYSDGLNPKDEISWDQFKNKLTPFESFTNYSLDKTGKRFSTLNNEFQLELKRQYMDSARYQNKKYFVSEIALKGLFYDYYKSRYDRESANEVFLELKDFETNRMAARYEQVPSFKTYFAWKTNQFLKVFSAYGTEPARAIIFSLYVILFFALIYLFFPNSWDGHGRRRIMDRYRFFTKYMNQEAGIHEVYLEEQEAELLESEDFKNYMQKAGKTIPKFFMATAMPLYKWSVSGTKLSAAILKRVDIMRGSWNELPESKRIWKSFLLIGVFVVAIIYDLFIKMLNALMLSINTFTTLGFGEIPIKGLPRYLAIIQGFIGWFMLTIFSVSLISQLLN